MTEQIILKKEWGSWFNLIVVWPFKVDGKYKVANLKGQLNMHADKAIGALHWLRSVFGDRHQPCFLYCPDVESIYGDGIGYDHKDLFEDDDDIYSTLVNEKKVEELIDRFGGYLPVDSWDEWIISQKNHGEEKIEILDDLGTIFSDEFDEEEDTGYD